MNKILAVAALTLRTAVRSRVFALLAALLMISIVGLPFILKGDGTLAGTVQLYLYYALGSAIMLLSVAAIWAGSGAFSLEVENHEVQLLVTKPVCSIQLWFGKWLGLMVMNAILIGLAGALTYGMLRWTTRPSRLSIEDQRVLREEILVARSELLPQLPDHKDVTKLPAGTLSQKGRIIVQPGGKCRWRFKLPARLRSDDTVLLQFRFVTSNVLDSSPVKGLWLIGPASTPESFQILKTSTPNVSHQLKFPASALVPGQVVNVMYSNTDSARAVTILFPADDSVKLLLREGGFEMNYARALLVTLARLAFFSALGLTAGALFSFPVAVFTSFAFLLISGVSRFVERVAEYGASEIFGTQTPEQAATVWQSTVQCLFIVLNHIIPPLSQFQPLNLLPDGELISWGFVGNAFMVLVGVYSGLLALTGACLFSRRELGLPS